MQSLTLGAAQVERGGASRRLTRGADTDAGAAAATLGSLDKLLPGEVADLSAQLDASGDMAFLSLQSPWAPTGVRFAIAEQQSEQDGVVGVTVKLPATVES